MLNRNRKVPTYIGTNLFYKYFFLRLFRKDHSINLKDTFVISKLSKCKFTIIIIKLVIQIFNLCVFLYFFYDENVREYKCSLLYNIIFGGQDFNDNIFDSIYRHINVCARYFTSSRSNDIFMIFFSSAVICSCYRTIDWIVSKLQYQSKFNGKVRFKTVY